MAAEVSFPNWLVWDHLTELDDEAALVAYHKRVSPGLNGDSLLSTGYLVLKFPAVVFLLGFVVTATSGRASWFLLNPTFHVFSVILTVALATIAWFDKAVIRVILAIRPAFDISDSAYYRLMGEFVERLYEPFPFAPRPKERQIHRPTAFAVLFGIVIFIVLPVGLFPEHISTIFGHEWGGLPFPIQAYVIGLIIIAIFVGVTTSWIVFVGSYFMSYRIQEFPIRLDVTRRRDNLGLSPYARVVLKALLAYLFAYSVMSSLLVIRDLNLKFVIGLFFMSLLPLVGFVGSQYGLHKAIERTKTARLRELREEFDSELQQWFLTGNSAPPDTTESDIAQFMMAKEAIDDLPEWPVRFNSVAQLISATVASNIWVGLQVVGLIS